MGAGATWVHVDPSFFSLNIVPYGKTYFPSDFFIYNVFPLTDFIVRLQSIKYITHRICVNRRLVLLVRLPVNSTLLGVTFWGSRNLYSISGGQHSQPPCFSRLNRVKYTNVPQLRPLGQTKQPSLEVIRRKKVLHLPGLLSVSVARREPRREVMAQPRQESRIGKRPTGRGFSSCSPSQGLRSRSWPGQRRAGQVEAGQVSKGERCP